MGGRRFFSRRDRFLGRSRLLSTFLPGSCLGTSLGFSTSLDVGRLGFFGRGCRLFTFSGSGRLFAFGRGCGLLTFGRGFAFCRCFAFGGRFSLGGLFAFGLCAVTRFDLGRRFLGLYRFGRGCLFGWLLDLGGENLHRIGFEIDGGFRGLFKLGGFVDDDFLVDLLFDVVDLDDVVHNDVVLDDDRAKEFGLIEEIGLVFTKDELDAQVWFDEGPDGDEEPVVLGHLAGTDLDADLEAIAFRTQRSPADIIVAAAPGDPGRSPCGTRNPAPAEPVVVVPAAIMIDGPGEGLVGGEIPAIVGKIQPAASRVGRPTGIDPAGAPHIAVLRVAHPDAVRLEFIEKQVEIDAHPLGLGRRDAQHGGWREAGGKSERGGCYAAQQF